MFAAPPVVPTEIFTRLPDEFRIHGRESAWTRSRAGIRTINVTYGGRDRRTLFITESEHGVVLTARMEAPGRPMYSHL